MINNEPTIAPRVNDPIIGPLQPNQFQHQLTPVGRKAAYELLASPRRTSNKTRKQIKRALQRHLTTALESPIPTAVKLAKRFAALPRVKLGSLQRRFAKRASTAKHVLLKLEPGSPFAPAVQQQQIDNLNAFRQVNAEIEARQLVANPDFGGFK